MTSRVGLIVVAAGRSRRMGGHDKVWEPLRGEPLLLRSLRTLAPLATATVLVVRADQIERAKREIGPLMPGLRIVAGGKERQDSVRNGLDALPESDVIAVHDAARPLVPADLLVEGVALTRNHAGAIPVVPLHDTLRRVMPGRTAGETVDRSTLCAVQTPQVFQSPALIEAYRVAGSDGHLGTDEASLVDRIGREIATYAGSEENFKITTEFDLRVARMLAESVA